MISLLLVLCFGSADAARPPTDYRTTLGKDLAAQASKLNAQGQFKAVVALVERFEDAVEPLPPLSYEAGYALKWLRATNKHMWC